MLHDCCPADARRLFRQVFLWSLCGFALVASVRGDEVTPPPVPDDAQARWEVEVNGQSGNPLAAGSFAATETDSAPVEFTTTFETADGPWTVVISPKASTSARGPYAMTYEEAYAQIPYRRAEYLANPGYRHEAALELMFGQMRQTTVVSQRDPQTIPVPQSSPYKPYRYSTNELWTNPGVNGPMTWGNGFGGYGWGGYSPYSTGRYYGSGLYQAQPMLSPALPMLY
jgi:hypothetical protein